MKRLINIRLPVIFAVSLAAGAGLGYLFLFCGLGLFTVIAVVPVAALIFILCAVFKRSKLCLVCIALCALLIFAGSVNCFLRLDGFTKNELDEEKTYYITAVVYEKGENDYGEYIVLKSVTADGKKINGKLIAYLGKTYGEFCDTGYRVSFTSDIKKNELFIDGNLNHLAYSNVKYSCNVYGGLTAEYKFSLLGKIRSVIRKTLYDNLDKNTAAIAYAMLTGNTQGVDDGTMEGFRHGGIAHVFAVSGLHIGIVYGILYFIFKKLKINKFVSAGLCILPVFFYAGVCGFTLSAVRASIMCTVSAFA